MLWGNVTSVFHADLAIDLGTANTLVHVRGEGVVLNEPSVVAIVRDGHEVKTLAVGKDAKEMLGRTPGNITAIRPMRDGVIADFSVTEAMIKSFIRKAMQRSFILRSRLIISVPAGVTSIEQKAVREAAMGAGVREVHLIEQPIAAAVGAGLPVQEAQGSMIIDIGGGTTDVAVISFNGLVASHTLRIAGDELDKAIVNFVRKHHNILIGERTAEYIKIQVGSAYMLDEELQIEVKGRDLLSGVPRCVLVTSPEIRDALQDHVRQFVGCARMVLEKTPPELSADIIEQGIVLCGGGAQIKGLDKLISQECCLPVRVADNPLHAVVDGVGTVLQDIPGYEDLLI
ncbi:MAG: rod shape-determining protein [Myxococcota bacterium]